MHRYYYGLDALRFFSAFAVVLFHLGFYVWATDYSSMETIFANSASFEALTPVAWWGWIGVQIFFVISGFVIANSANGATPFVFVRSRLLRLWPAAWICATITLAVRLIAGEQFFRDLDGPWLRSLILWPKGEWIDGPYWSLAVEIAFYALVFCLLLTQTFRRLPLLAWALALLSGAYICVAAMRDFGMSNPGGWFDAISGYAELLPLRHGVYFAIGIWMWMFANRSLPKSAWPGLAIATGFGVVEILMRAHSMQQFEAAISASQPIIVPVLVWLLAVGVILACTRRPENFAPASEGGRQRLQLIGKITYPLYLVHSALGAGAVRIGVEIGLPPYLALLAGLVVVLAVATLIALYAEPLARAPLRAGLDAVGNAASRLKPLRLLFRQSDAIPLNRS